MAVVKELAYTGRRLGAVQAQAYGLVNQVFDTPEALLAAALDAGARLAEPGEFTRRAFLNGRLDLAQAEAVADLIASNAEAGRKAALDTMRGGFSAHLAALREQLLRFSALIELELDFSEEDVEFANRSQLRASVERLREKLNHLITSFELGNVIRNGIPVVIAGKPNAGKSTLLNSTEWFG